MATPNLETDFLAEVAPEEIGAEVVLENPAQVDYQIQKIARFKAKQEEIKAFAKRQIEDAQNWMEGRLKTLQDQIDWFSSPLEVYIRGLHRKTEGKQKSLDLPHGKLKLIKQSDKFEYDEEAIFGWLKDRPDLSAQVVGSKLFILKDKLKKWVKDTGETPDGVTITPAEEPKFFIDIKGVKTDDTSN